MHLTCDELRVAVHSRNSTCPTSTGFGQRQSFILAFVRPAPHRPLFASGRLTKGTLLGFRRFAATRRDELNYGNILTIYDRVFGRYTPGERACSVIYDFG